MKTFGVLAVFCVVLAGCGVQQQAKQAVEDLKELDPENSDAYKSTTSTKAMSLLKQYTIAQELYRNQNDGRYGSLKELDAQQLIDEQLALASDLCKPPAPVGGYVFADIIAEADGKPLQRGAHSGLSTYSKSGGAVILMLMSDKEPAGWAFYFGDPKKVRGAVRRWPSADDLKSKYTRMSTRSPEEAADEANRILDALDPTK